MPKYQVIKFQVIAAKSAAKIINDPFSKTKGSTISFVIVLATPVNVIAPRNFIKEANIIACLGCNAFVDTEVAIALAVSSNPLIKSKITAQATIKIVINNTVSILSKYSFNQAFFMIIASSVL